MFWMQNCTKFHQTELGRKKGQVLKQVRVSYQYYAVLLMSIVSVGLQARKF